MITTWKEPAYEYLLKQDYLAVADYYEKTLETEPENYNYYWYLGLAYLLQEQEEEAQSTWLFAITQGIEEEADELIQELVEILSTEAQRQESLGDYQKSWLIRGHLREIASNLINNLLKLIQLEISLKIFTPEKLNDWGVIELLQQSSKNSVDSDLLLEVLKKVLEFSTAETVAFAEASLAHLPSSEIFIETVVPMVLRLPEERDNLFLAADILKLCLELQPDNLELFKKQLYFYTQLQNYQQVLEIARRYYENCDTLQKKVFVNYYILYTLIVSGDWQEVELVAQRHRELLQKIIQRQPVIEPVITSCLASLAVPLPYLQDNLVENRWLQNQVSLLFQKNFCNQTSTSTQKFDSNIKTSSFLIKQKKQLKIGYIAHTLRKHSVGWLARWLFHYHNREEFQIVIYLGSELEDEITEIWYKQKVDLFRNFQEDVEVIAQQIREDEIDILVDLDSLTRNITCQIMALKPSPVQVTWLGFDASGLPTIDYFIADPYVLPENAQAHYTEKLWRLPNTYLAVDGFEIGIPTLCRDDLGIPDDAVIYLSSHGGYKRHPAAIRLQMQIIKEVANSYLLIKGVGDEKSVKQLFSQLAEEEGVDLERLKFLPRDLDEYTHRANLQIADIALDAYPYNGATTTLEILWVGIPLVTRVGEQFAARNSYTFLRNVGVEEGIAWTDEEYIEWGVRLGKDKTLRREINLKLKAAKQTSPLWNAQQFTHDLEQSYQKMWINYCS
jgi:predicted O-linked N-acetylglucosamine transferase (SPINDLY family)